MLNSWIHLLCSFKWAVVGNDYLVCAAITSFSSNPPLLSGWVDAIVFFGLPLLSSGVAACKTPINSLFCLIGVFFLVVLMLIESKVEFLSMILLIVYVGAIAILFLFVVMLFNLNPADEAEDAVEGVGGIIGWSNMAYFFITLNVSLVTLRMPFDVHYIFTGSEQNSLTAEEPENWTQVANLFDYFSNDALLFNQRLYGEDAFLFLLSGMLLLVSMVGAIVLAMSTLESMEVKSTPRQAAVSLFWFGTEGHLLSDSENSWLDWTNVALTLLVSVVLCFILFSVSYFFSTSIKADLEKEGEYECGFEPFDDATRQPFDVHFYIVGILFLIFDVEIAMLFPWATGFGSLELKEHLAMFAFLGILTLGFFYEWQRGALAWPLGTFLIQKK